MFQLTHFKAYEVVPESVYIDRGEKALQLLDVELLTFIDRLRAALGRRITINTWKWGGKHSYRGLRNSGSKYFKLYSQHTYGKALDFTVEGMASEEVRNWIIEHRNLYWVKPITFLENDVSWVHIDTRPSLQDKLLLWSPLTNKTKIFERG